MTHMVLGEGTPMVCYRSSENISGHLVRAKFDKTDVSLLLSQRERELDPSQSQSE